MGDGSLFASNKKGHTLRMKHFKWEHDEGHDVSERWGGSSNAGSDHGSVHSDHGDSDHRPIFAATVRRRHRFHLWVHGRWMKLLKWRRTKKLIYWRRWMKQ